MRTARRVIVCILLSASCGTRTLVQAQSQDPGVGSPVIDRTLTIVGRDETSLPVPPPADIPPALPEIEEILRHLDTEWMTSLELSADAAALLPAPTPPPAMLPFPLAVPDPRDVLADALAE